MTLYDGPRDVIAHLHQLEVNLGATAYDHSRPPATGWRAERQKLEMASHGIGSQKSFCSKPSVVHSLLSWLFPPLVAEPNS